ncbi:MAG: VIT family protein [Planctomycetaceae bacterium]
MPDIPPALELHRLDRVGWLRAGVLGANDGIVSVASLVVGVAAAQPDRQSILLSGVAGLVAGAMSMAAGEYVSVSTQADTEQAERQLEADELQTDPEGELRELTGIYVRRGLDEPLARQVAEQLTARDALGAHLRDELGITDDLAARPVQAALVSAAAFGTGAALPLLVVLLAPSNRITWAVSFATVLSLIGLGTLSAHLGGADKVKGALRVTFWGIAALASTALIGWLFGVTAG